MRGGIAILTRLQDIKNEKNYCFNIINKQIICTSIKLSTSRKLIYVHIVCSGALLLYLYNRAILIWFNLRKYLAVTASRGAAPEMK